MAENPSTPLTLSFRRLIDTLNMAGAVLSLDGVILSATPWFADMLGVARDQLEGLPFERLVALGERRSFARLLAQGRACPGSLREFILRRGDGDPLYTQLSLRRLEPPNPEAIMVVAVDLTPFQHTAARLRREKEELEARVQERTAELEEDVHRRATLEAALRASEAKWRLLFNATPTMVLVTTLEDGHVLEVNETLLRTLEYRPLEVLGRRIMDLGFWEDPRDRALWAEALQRHGQVDELEHRFVTKSGKVRVGLISSQLIDLSGRKVVLSVVQDITERKRAEACLAEQQHLLRTILEQAAEGIVVRDAEGRILFTSAAAREIARREPNRSELEATDEVWGPAYDGAGRRLPLAALPSSRALAGEIVTGAEIGRVYPDGRSCTLLVSAAPLRGAEQQILGAVTTYMDITARKQAEAEIATQKALLETVLEQGAEPVAVVDAHGVVLLANSAIRQLYGFDPRGKPFREALERLGQLYDGEERPVPFEAHPVQRALRGETITGRHQSFVRPEGTRYYYRISAAPIRSGEEVIAVVAVLADMTAEREAAARLRAALVGKEAALADNETLLREVHHRVKNNLQMLCDLLYLQMETLADRDQQAILQDTYGRIYAIARLHEQLYRSMHSGRIQLGAYLGRLAGAFEDLYPAVRIKVETSADDLRLDVDRAIHTGLIVNELLTSALKHASRLGTTAEIAVRLRLAGDHVELEVRDNGKGLPTDLDLEPAKTLGLRIVDILARRLQAVVKVQHSGGTAFTMTFPLEGETAVDPQRP